MCSVVWKMSNVLYWSLECEEFEQDRCSVAFEKVEGN